MTKQIYIASSLKVARKDFHTPPANDLITCDQTLSPNDLGRTEGSRQNQEGYLKNESLFWVILSVLAI